MVHFQSIFFKPLFSSFWLRLFNADRALDLCAIINYLLIHCCIFFFAARACSFDGMCISFFSLPLSASRQLSFAKTTVFFLRLSFDVDVSGSLLARYRKRVSAWLNQARTEWNLCVHRKGEQKHLC